MTTRYWQGLSLNLHFHALVIDGVYTQDGPLDRPRFREVPAWTQAELELLVDRIQSRVLRLLRRRGLWPDSNEPTAEEPEPDSLMPILTAASIQGRVALSPDAGQPVERLGHPQPAGAAQLPTLCANKNGFSLHAQVRVEVGDRERLELLCRDALRRSSRETSDPRR